ncbi:ubiquitin carboxyl-terminal hydrolase [Anaeramoeba flamelloides]|uniref:Ubiquitin carboxyl-terminal hydrolase n=1 Tax=Anaeramoeba flamelloides TaxID=1746091 RepID=A0ABQ8X9Y9_9EUKA|nr:ubiquitin carboxyl-terminal hydrolase [Anaeramoeba flamelloides]
MTNKNFDMESIIDDIDLYSATLTSAAYNIKHYVGFYDDLMYLDQQMDLYFSNSLDEKRTRLVLKALTSSLKHLLLTDNITQRMMPDFLRILKNTILLILSRVDKEERQLLNLLNLILSQSNKGFYGHNMGEKSSQINLPNEFDLSKFTNETNSNNNESVQTIELNEENSNKQQVDQNIVKEEESIKVLKPTLEFDQCYYHSNYLIENIRYFAESNGIQIVLDYLLSSNHIISEIKTELFLKVLDNISDCLRNEYFSPFFEKIQQLYSRLLKMDVKKIRDFDKEKLSQIIGRIKNILMKIDYREFLNVSRIFDLNFALKQLNSSYLDLKIAGINIISELCDQVLDNQINKNNENNDDQLMNEMMEKDLNTFLNWFEENNFIKILFGTNMHDQILKYYYSILKLLGFNNQINKSAIDLIWNELTDCYSARKELVYQLINSFSPYLYDTLLSYLYSTKIKTIKKWDNFNINFLFNFIQGTLHILQDPLDLLWELIMNNTIQKKFQMQLSNFFQSLFCYYSFKLESKLKFLRIFSENLTNIEKTKFIFPLLESLIFSFPYKMNKNNNNNNENENKIEEKDQNNENKEDNENKNLKDLTFSKVLEDLETNFNFIARIIDGIDSYQKNIKQIIKKNNLIINNNNDNDDDDDNDNNDNDNNNNINLEKNINEQINWSKYKFIEDIEYLEGYTIRLNFITKLCNSYNNINQNSTNFNLTIDHMKKMWEIFVNNTLLKEESDYFFQWVITIGVSIPIGKFLFENLLKLSSKEMTESELNFFKYYTYYENYINRNIFGNFQNFIVKITDLNLINGYSKIWEIIKDIKNEKLLDQIIFYLIQYQNISFENIKKHGTKIRITFLNQIIEKIKETPTNNVNIIIRYLKILLLFINQIENNILPENLKYKPHIFTVLNNKIKLKIKSNINNENNNNDNNKNNIIKYYDLIIKENHSIDYLRNKISELFNEKIEDLEIVNLPLNLISMEYGCKLIGEQKLTKESEIFVQKKIINKDNKNKKILPIYNIPLENNLMPSYLLSNYFNIFFKLLEINNEDLYLNISILLLKMPTNKFQSNYIQNIFNLQNKKVNQFNINSDSSKKKINWNRILNHESLFFLIYNLQIINGFIEEDLNWKKENGKENENDNENENENEKENKNQIKNEIENENENENENEKEKEKEKENINENKNKKNKELISFFYINILKILPIFEKETSNTKMYFKLFTKLIKLIYYQNLNYNFNNLFTDLNKKIIQRKIIETWPISNNNYVKVVDESLIGMLKILTVLIKFSHKIDLNQNEDKKLILKENIIIQIINLIFKQYLYKFPKIIDYLNFPQLPKFKNDKTRKQAFKLLYTISFLNENYYKNIIDLLIEQEKQLPLLETWYFSPEKETRTNIHYIGLKNLGSLCYMNSLLQQLFHNLEFQKLILSLNIKPNKENFLYQLQILFVQLNLSENKFINPIKFLENFQLPSGEQIKFGKQEDAFEFFNLIFQIIERELSKLNQSNFIQTLFGGKLISQIIGEGTTQRSERIENFFSISLDVNQNQDLMNSLNEYIQGEKLEGDNQWYSEELGKKVNARKRVLIENLPKNLIIHLKRFEYDMSSRTRKKLNHECNFPLELDMHKFTKKYILKEEMVKEKERGKILKEETKNEKKKEKENKNELGNLTECTKYELCGIIVHSGTSQSGHYYSLIKINNGNGEPYWLKFDDTRVSKFNETDIQKECFGGSTLEYVQDYNGNYVENWVPKQHSAYMLYYRRKDYFKVKNLQANEIIQLLQSSYSQENNEINPILLNIWNENLNFFYLKTIYHNNNFKFVYNLLNDNSFTFNKNNINSISNNFQLLLNIFKKLIIHSDLQINIQFWCDLIIIFLVTSDDCRNIFIDELKWKNSNKSWISNLLFNCPNRKLWFHFQFIFIMTFKYLIENNEIENNLCSSEIKLLKNVQEINYKKLFNSEIEKNNENKNQDLDQNKSIEIINLNSKFNNNDKFQNYNNLNFLSQFEFKSFIFRILKIFIYELKSLDTNNCTNLSDYFTFLIQILDIGNYFPPFFLNSLFLTNIIDFYLGINSPYQQSLDDKKNSNNNNNNNFFVDDSMIDFNRHKYATMVNFINVLLSYSIIDDFDYLNNLNNQLMEYEDNLAEFNNNLNIINQELNNYEKNIHEYGKFSSENSLQIQLLQNKLMENENNETEVLQKIQDCANNMDKYDNLLKITLNQKFEKEDESLLLNRKIQNYQNEIIKIKKLLLEEQNKDLLIPTTINNKYNNNYIKLLLPDYNMLINTNFLLRVLKCSIHPEQLGQLVLHISFENITFFDNFLNQILVEIQNCSSHQLNKYFPILSHLININDHSKEEKIQKIVNGLISSLKNKTLNENMNRIEGYILIFIQFLKEISTNNQLVSKNLFENRNSWLFDFLIINPSALVRENTLTLIKTLLPKFETESTDKNVDEENKSQIENNKNKNENEKENEKEKEKEKEEEEDNDEKIMVLIFISYDLFAMFNDISNNLYFDLNENEKNTILNEQRKLSLFKLSQYFDLLTFCIKHGNEIIKLSFLENLNEFWNLFQKIISYQILYDLNLLYLLQFWNFCLFGNDGNSKNENEMLLNSSFKIISQSKTNIEQFLSINIFHKSQNDAKIIDYNKKFLSIYLKFLKLLCKQSIQFQNIFKFSNCFFSLLNHFMIKAPLINDNENNKGKYDDFAITLLDFCKSFATNDKIFRSQLLQFSMDAEFLNLNPEIIRKLIKCCLKETSDIINFSQKNYLQMISEFLIKSFLEFFKLSNKKKQLTEKTLIEKQLLFNLITKVLDSMFELIEMYDPKIMDYEIVIKNWAKKDSLIYYLVPFCFMNAKEHLQLINGIIGKINLYLSPFLNDHSYNIITTSLTNHYCSVNPNFPKINFIQDINDLNFQPIYHQFLIKIINNSFLNDYVNNQELMISIFKFLFLFIEYNIHNVEINNVFSNLLLKYSHNLNNIIEIIINLHEFFIYFNVILLHSDQKINIEIFNVLINIINQNVKEYHLLMFIQKIFTPIMNQTINSDENSPNLFNNLNSLNILLNVPNWKTLYLHLNNNPIERLNQLAIQIEKSNLNNQTKNAFNIFLSKFQTNDYNTFYEMEIEEQSTKENNNN